MRCPSCGATYDGNSAKCSECQTEAVNDAANSETYSYPLENQLSEITEFPEAALEDAGVDTLKELSSLIQFPGATRSSVPQWRKDLSDRVREIQEQRAREAALAKKKTRLKERRNGSKRAPQLALLESPETPELNPIVAAALRRIGRAHQPAEPESPPRVRKAVESESPPRVGNAVESESPPRVRNAVEPESPPRVSSNSKGTVVSTREIVAPAPAASAAEVLPDDVPVPAAEMTEPSPPEQKPVSTEKLHNLIVVPPVVKQPDKQEQPILPKQEQPRPKRLIGDDLNHPALNYLDSISQTVQSENSPRQRASGFRRILSAFLDLLVIGCFSSPFVSALYLIAANSRAPMVIMTAVFVVLLVGFLYLTVATALTGRTLGMRLLSLRVIDARTGLIPTGNQSAGRALLYLASLLSLGIALIYAVADSERRPAHDRLTGTAVVRA